MVLMVMGMNYVDVEEDDETSSESLPKTPRVLTTITSLVAFTSSIFTLIDDLYWITVTNQLFPSRRNYMDIQGLHGYMYIIHSSGRGQSIYVRCEEFSEDWLSIKDNMMAVVTNPKTKRAFSIQN